MVPIDRNGVLVDIEPNYCPVCNHTISPNKTDVLKEIFTNNPHFSSYLEILYECPSSNCGYLFLAHFERKSETKNTTNGFFTYTHSTPNHFKRINFDQRIVEISPNFIDIFNQSANAESNDLSEICGMGYRKALEFLIKDYCVHINPDDVQKIKSMKLMPCIKNYITDANIKECATRAVWLGNDETHYERRWKNKDIEDLKLLINLVVNWVVSSLMTQEYMESMQRT